MGIIYKSVNLDNWIYQSTEDSKSLVELGAGFFNRLGALHPNVKTRIGIEIYQPYIDNARFHDCVKIKGDALNYKELLRGYEIDTVLIIDVLEHFEKEVGYKLIEDLKKDFKKIVLMLPVGKHELHEDVTGYGGHEFQTHRSYWYENDIEALHFIENTIDLNFHMSKPDKGCYFGIWR